MNPILVIVTGASRGMYKFRCDPHILGSPSFHSFVLSLHSFSNHFTIIFPVIVYPLINDNVGFGQGVAVQFAEALS